MKYIYTLITIFLIGCLTGNNEKNVILVHSSNLDIESLKIFWKTERQDSILVFEDSKYLMNIGNVYGKNGFIIYLGNNYIGNVGHFKTRNKDIHKYIIDINKNPDKESYNIKFNAIGVDSVFDEITFVNGEMLQD
ncbi:MAG: hypothetical protein OQJ96_07570 [Flavobacteriales bacterium]|nr:hypothetical protein [Flavobacteriales bacterium]MCW8913168.1 hypothetical protein [Flavobacteriales bacterium]MCW8937423.1 hypothetical protein [Flavobacteriales bacterium]MCW8940020.1 hypothetical protein [Flavobacteriales bacterium]MCW8968654.1 hypothetical protein [Flavobacteriales bacterium]